uniref:Uncharacterized protein n=1 Tax=Arundo donax TaxID=35708 RepID=A0A0A8Y234_ARUDO
MKVWNRISERKNEEGLGLSWNCCQLRFCWMYSQLKICIVLPGLLD